jgi:hypothetical protein
MPGRSQPLKALRALELIGAAPHGHGVAGGVGARRILAPQHPGVRVPAWFTELRPN